MKLAILRTAVGSVAGIGIIKLFQQNGISVIGTDICTECVGKFFTQQYYSIPKAIPRNEVQIIEQYLYIVKTHRISAILAGPEEEILILSRFRHLFEELNCQILHPSENSLEILTNKLKLNNHFKNIIPMAWTHSLDNKSLSSINIPQELIIKPISGRGSNGVLRISKSTFEKLDLSTFKNCIVQEYLAGTEFSVDTLSNKNGELIEYVIRKRNKTESGIAVVSETVNEVKIEAKIMAIFASIKIYGANCIQFIEHSGEFYLTDFNPRIGGSAILSFNSSPTFFSNLIELIKNANYSNSNKIRNYSLKKMYRYYAESFQN